MLRHLKLVAVLAAVALASALLAACTPPTPLSLDYSHEHALPAFQFAADETGYQSPNVLGNDAAEQQRFKSLGVKFMRMDLTVVNGVIQCGASGCDSGVSADAYINAIIAVGATPVVIVPTTPAASAATIVSHFGSKVVWYLVGNEPNINGYSAATYTADWNADAAAMRAANPLIKIGGPTPAWFDQTFVQYWLSNANNPQFIDVHGYPTKWDAASLWSWAQGIGSGTAQAHSMALATLGHDVPVELGEWSLDFDEGSGSEACTRSNFADVWSTDVLGHLVANNVISLYYGTKGNMLEWASGTHTNCDTGQTVSETLDGPHAGYEGYVMFTGGGLFPGFGTKMATCSGAPSGVDCFASDGGSHNIVLVNRGSSDAVVSWGSTGDVWQRAPGLAWNAAPSHLGSKSAVTLPALSATTVVLP